MNIIKYIGIGLMLVSGYLFIRNGITFNLSKQAGEYVYMFNIKQIGNGLYPCRLQYDDVIKPYNKIMWDFRIWKVKDAFKNKEVYEKIIRELFDS